LGVVYPTASDIEFEIARPKYSRYFIDRRQGTDDQPSENSACKERV
jgi:hypothetical protein